MEFGQGPDQQGHQSPPATVPAREALSWSMGNQGVDMRPYLVTKQGQEILVDSGSQICAWPPDPGDQPDPNVRLRAVNGNQIQCFGKKQIEVKIGRKAYSFTAIKANVPGPIIGWDFIRKYRLGFVWGEGEEGAYLRDFFFFYNHGQPPVNHT